MRVLVANSLVAVRAAEISLYSFFVSFSLMDFAKFFRLSGIVYANSARSITERVVF